jgi:hypothetical protein
VRNRREWRAALRLLVFFTGRNCVFTIVTTAGLLEDHSPGVKWAASFWAFVGFVLIDSI